MSTNRNDDVSDTTAGVTSETGADATTDTTTDTTDTAGAGDASDTSAASQTGATPPQPPQEAERPVEEFYQPEATTGLGYAPDLGVQPVDEDVTIWPPHAAAQDPRTAERAKETPLSEARIEGVRATEKAPTSEDRAREEAEASGVVLKPRAGASVESGAQMEQKAASTPGETGTGK